MTILLVVAVSLQIVSTAPPLSPEQATAVLRACPCLSNRTNATPPIEPPPPSIVIRSDSRSGPFGVLQLSPSRPTCCDLYIGGHCQLEATAATVAGCLTMWRAIHATGSRPRLSATPSGSTTASR